MSDDPLTVINVKWNRVLVYLIPAESSSCHNRLEEFACNLITITCLKNGRKKSFLNLTHIKHIIWLEVPLKCLVINSSTIITISCFMTLDGISKSMHMFSIQCRLLLFKYKLQPFCKSKQFYSFLFHLSGALSKGSTVIPVFWWVYH